MQELEKRAIETISDTRTDMEYLASCMDTMWNYTEGYAYQGKNTTGLPDSQVHAIVSLMLEKMERMTDELGNTLEELEREDMKCKN